MKLPHLRSEQIKNQPDQTAALINRLVDEVEKKGGGGGGGGTNDFDQLINRPSYNNTTMTSSTNIPLVPTKTSQLTNDSNFATTTQVNTAVSNHNSSTTAHSDIREEITDIQDVIPTAATSSNKLTDKNYVDDSINSVTAYYITKNAAGDAFATKAELTSATVFYSGGQVRIPTRNDYCIVEADESKRDPITGEDPTTRYIYNNGWEFQYIVNKTALTADQLAALNSGVTAADVTKLSGIQAGAEVNVQSDWTEADTTSDAYILNKPSIPPYMVELSYGHSTWNEFITAYNTHSVVYCKASSNSNPGTGSQTRKAFLAYVNNDTNPTEVEFQYYRSVATHSDSQQGDQVFVYKFKSNGTWSVTTREAYTKIAAGTNMSSSYNNGTLTLNATDTTYSAGNGLSLTGTTFEIDTSVVAEVSDIPTKTSELANDGSDGTSTYVEADDLAAVATSGDYSDLNNTPTIPTLYTTLGQNTDGALTQKASTDYFNDAAYVGTGTPGTMTPWVTDSEIDWSKFNRFKFKNGNAASYSITGLYCYAGSTGFLHQMLVQTHFDSMPRLYIVSWTGNGNVYQTEVSGGGNLSITLNSYAANTNSVDMTLTFPSTCYGGIRVISLG